MASKKFATVIFPSCNKNHTKAENFESMVLYGTHEERCRVVKTITLGYDEFNQVYNSLLDNRPEMWGQIGGSESEAPELENVTYEQLCASKELMQIFRNTCYTLVVEVVNEETGASFFVNTEGYDYARYVGVKKPNTEFEYIEEPKTPEQIADEKTVKVGSIFSESWGYEQTNIDFYQVVEMKGSMVTLREISQQKTYDGPMTGKCTPIKDSFVDAEPFRKKLKTTKDGTAYVNSKFSTGWCKLYDGTPKYFSQYA